MLFSYTILGVVSECEYAISRKEILVYGDLNITSNVEVTRGVTT
jgi:hypothetical protein